VESKSVEFVRRQRDVRVSKVNITNAVEEFFALAFEVLDQPLACSHVAMSNFWDQPMDSSSNDG